MALLLAAVPLARTAAQTTVGPSGVRSGRTANDCRGGSLRVDGNGNHLHAARCAAIAVNGNGNTVDVSYAGPGRLDIMGNGNHATWHAAPQVQVAVTDTGSGNTVAGR